ncbi:T9SS type A sorting domain-containing protein, partial [candidate division KSB1 bacterium]|nr:T9SS type A sorting domain-containing protein [candidate division KSB1 bacterium]
AYVQCRPTMFLTDHDNPNFMPINIANVYAVSGWKQTGNKWMLQLSDNSYRNMLLGCAPESPDRSYLRIFENENDRFYQLSLLPPVETREIKNKNILLAVDLADNDRGVYNKSFLFEQFENTTILSTTPYDSITMLYSAFTPEIYDTNFVPVTTEHINKMFSELRQRSNPKLNTLPHLLRQAVKVLNDKGKSGEIWLLTNAYTHSDPPETALEIITQTLNIAENPVVFRIINADMEYWPNYWINNQRYSGNDYLYENLARLSWGSFITLRDYQQYDILDIMLDCVAPTVTSVETIPDPTGGISYSRFQLNRGRINFPITLPYYEIGLFDGTEPFFVNYFGMLYGDLFAKGVTVERQIDDTGWVAVSQFWYDRYIQNLLLEPQSYETISYIENTSVEHSLLTPYSGLVVPGPDGVPAFLRLTEEIPTSVEINEPAIQAPQNDQLLAYPNPFNPSTTITVPLPPDLAERTLNINIYNYLGQMVRHHSERVNPSDSNIRYRWDGLDENGREAASGLYLVIVQSGRYKKNLKITLLR